MTKYILSMNLPMKIILILPSIIEDHAKHSPLKLFRDEAPLGNPCLLLRSWKIDLFDDVVSCLLFTYFFLSVIQEFYYSEESNKKRRCKKSESNTNFT